MQLIDSEVFDDVNIYKIPPDQKLSKYFLLGVCRGYINEQFQDYNDEVKIRAELWLIWSILNAVI